MIGCKLFLACALSLTDAETGAVSYVQVMETMTAASLPSTMPDFHLCTVFEKTSTGQAAAQLRILLQRPSGEEAVIVPARDLAFESLRFRFSFRINGLGINEPGPHWFRLDLRESVQHPWRTAADWPLFIGLREGQEPQPTET